MFSRLPIFRRRVYGRHSLLDGLHKGEFVVHVISLGHKTVFVQSEEQSIVILSCQVVRRSGTIKNPLKIEHNRGPVVLKSLMFILAVREFEHRGELPYNGGAKMPEAPKSNPVTLGIR